MTNLRLRLGAAGAAVVVFAFFAIANFVPKETRVASPLLPDDGLRLGLDLQGGIHWVLGVKLEVAEEQELDFLAENLKSVADDDAELARQLLLVDEVESAFEADPVEDDAEAGGGWWLAVVGVVLLAAFVAARVLSLT